MGLCGPLPDLDEEDAPQCKYPLREVFNGLRWIVRAGAPWRMLPTDLPPWEAVYQQTQRWLNAGVCEAMVNDLRQLLRVAAGRTEQPSGAIFDSRTLQSSPESSASGLRRSETAQREQGACGRRYAGSVVGAAGHPGQRAGPGPRGRRGLAGASGDG